MTIDERMGERKAFFASLGECITVWSNVERLIFTLFQSALGADREKSALIFWAIPTFSMRLSYTSMLVAHYLKGRDSSPKMQKQWEELERKVKKLSSFRNNLAHQPASETMTIRAEDENDGPMMIIPEGKIMPNPLDPHRKEFKPIVVADLEAHKKDVASLRENLVLFVLTIFTLENLKLPPPFDQI